MRLQTYSRICLGLVVALCSGQAEGLRLGVLDLPEGIRQGQPFTVRLPLEGDGGDPFDPEAIRVEAIVRPPCGGPMMIPGYYAEIYERPSPPASAAGGPTSSASDTGQGDKSGSLWKPSGEKGWRLRFRPLEAGPHRIQVRAETPTHWAQSAEARFTATPANSPGILRVSSRDPNYLEFSSGRPFFPIGLNVCWAEPVQLSAYLQKMAARGGNFTRLWMCPWNFPLEWKKAGEYDQVAAAQLDFVLAHCDRLGLQVMLCLDYHGALRQAESWAQNPYARARGGPCISTRDFFSNTGARKLYQNRLRYLAARYAASPSLGMWELFNEVDLTDPYPFCEREIARWHARMSRYLRSVDPYRHLVTTSVARAHTEEEHLWADRDMDVVQAHRYPGWRSLSVDTARALDLLQRYRRPRLLTEFGLDRDAARSFDPRGEGLLEAFWAGSLQGAAAAPMPWWWDSYIDELDLYHRLTGLARFLQDIDFPGESFRPLTGVSVETLPGAAARPANLLLQPEQSSFEPASFNQPRRFRVLPDGRVEGDAPLAELLHGTKAHPSLHNPQSFEVEYPADGFFTVLITEVSNWASTEVQVLVDSRVAFHRLFPDEDPGRGVQYRFNGACRVPVSAGRHTIVVKNEGGDWIRVAYVLESYVAPATSAVALYGLSGKSTILAWARHRGHTYYTRSLGVEAAPLDGIGLRWKRLPPGPWDISVWDPATGEVLARATATAVNGEVRIPLPAFLDGVAVKLVRRDVSGDLVSRFGSPPELPNRETR